MKKEYNLDKMKSRKNPYASKLKKPVTMRLSEDVVEYFMSRVYPQNCLEISSEEYEELQGQYETEARNNPPS